MSACSTATSAVRCNDETPRRRAPPVLDADDVEAVQCLLERRLVDLERDWNARKTAPRHRRSRSDTDTPPSSAITVAAPEPDALLLLLLTLLRRSSSPKRLLSSLQQTGSTDGDDIVGAAGSPTGCIGHAPSSVCSVEAAGYPVVASSSSSCSCCCRCVVCCSGYSIGSSCTGAEATSSSSAAGADMMGGELARKSDDGRRVAGIGRAAWISVAIAVVVMGVIAMVILVLSAEEGCAEYLVPT